MSRDIGSHYSHLRKRQNITNFVLCSKKFQTQKHCLIANHSYIDLLHVPRYIHTFPKCYYEQRPCNVTIIFKIINKKHKSHFVVTRIHLHIREKTLGEHDDSKKFKTRRTPISIWTQSTNKTGVHKETVRMK